MAMDKKLFKSFGVVHFPVSLVGWMILFSSIIFLVNVFLAVDRNSHSVSDTFYGIFPFFVPTFLLYEWIAEKTSRLPGA